MKFDLQLRVEAQKAPNYQKRKQIESEREREREMI
jgi:hypothetical protein